MNDQGFLLLIASVAIQYVYLYICGAVFKSLDAWWSRNINRKYSDE